MNKLQGRIFIEATIEAVTGLHIGASNDRMEIGGSDNPIIRDTISGKPYIPGSSLRGKMRSQLEKKIGAEQNEQIGKDVNIHICKDKNGSELCPVCQVFGVPGSKDTRKVSLLIVRDTFLTDYSANELDAAHTEGRYTEIKFEVAIDRVTSAASPRNIERVPAGAEFGPAELVFSIYEDADVQRLKTVLEGLLLVEDDYLGGSGSRGSGKVKFKNVKVSARSSRNYSLKKEYKTVTSVQELAEQFDDLQGWIRETIRE